MSTYLKINNSWTEINKIFKKVNGEWVQQNDIITALGDMIYVYGGHTISQLLEIISQPSYTGKSFLLRSTYDSNTIYPAWTIVSGNNYATINSNGKVTIEEGADNNTIVVQATYNGDTETASIVVSYDNQLSIESADTITGTSGNVIARYNSTIVTPTWTITSGNQYATIDANGTITITSSGTITVSASYNNYTATKNITLVYDSSTSTEVEVNPDGSTTTTVTITTQNQDGTTTETSVIVTTNEDGSTANTSSETTTNLDGSSSTTSTTTNSDGTSSASTTTVTAPDQNGSTISNTNTTNYDANGDVSGTSTNTTTNNQDGSSSSITTNYDENGDPTTGSTNNVDTSGNSHTQDVEYDENGDTTVTGYSVDTSGNSDGYQNISGQEVDTEYYAFDPTHAFELMLHFYFDPSQQTESQATVLNAKRADPKPWYGFDIRKKSSSNNLEWGVCFTGTHKVNGANKSSGTTTRADIAKTSNNIYKIKVNYDPTVASGETTFVMQDLITNTTLVTSNGKFPDDSSLKYIDITVGCALTSSGAPQRRAVMKVYEFYVTRL